MPKLYKRHPEGTTHIVCRATSENCGTVADWLVKRGATLGRRDDMKQIDWLSAMPWLEDHDYAVILGAEPTARGVPATIRKYGELQPEYELIGEYNG